MNTKLTLRLDDSLIAQAKQYAQTQKKSISQIVADYFKAIESRSRITESKIGPITSKLAGCLKETAAEEDDYKNHLERKFL
jgi:hypothetical protein